jgi:hypothetical protein
LIDALWESRLNPKDSIGHYPYTLIYGMEVRLPFHVELNVFILILDGEEKEEQEPIQNRYNELLQLEEQREQAILAISKTQEVVKKYFDKSETSKDF